MSILSLQLYLAGWQVHVLYWPNTKHMSFLVNKSYSLFCYFVVCLLVGWAWVNPTLDIELWFLRWGLALFPGHTGPIQAPYRSTATLVFLRSPSSNLSMINSKPIEVGNLGVKNCHATCSLLKWSPASVDVLWQWGWHQHMFRAALRSAVGTRTRRAGGKLHFYIRIYTLVP